MSVRASEPDAVSSSSNLFIKKRKHQSVSYNVIAESARLDISLTCLLVRWKKRTFLLFIGRHHNANCARTADAPNLQQRVWQKTVCVRCYLIASASSCNWNQMWLSSSAWRRKYRKLCLHSARRIRFQCETRWLLLNNQISCDTCKQWRVYC